MKELLCRKQGIQFLNLANNALGNRFLEGLSLPNLQSLELSNCKITCVSESEPPVFRKLNYLGLNQNRLGSLRSFRLIVMLRDMGLKMDVVKLDNNKVGNELIRLLSSELGASRPFLKQLSLKENLVDDEVYGLVKHFPLRLDLENNYV